MDKFRRLRAGCAIWTFCPVLALSCSAGYYTLDLMLSQLLSCKLAAMRLDASSRSGSGSYKIDDSRLFQPFIHTITLRRASRRFMGFCTYLILLTAGYLQDGHSSGRSPPQPEAQKHGGAGNSQRSVPIPPTAGYCRIPAARVPALRGPSRL